MKKTSFIKEALLLVTFVTAFLLITSCDNNQRPENTRAVAQEQEYNEAKLVSNMQENDAHFLVNAAEIDLEQIQLGKLAQQKGTATHVKELGKMMEDMHTKSLNDLTALAKSKMITIPTSTTDNARDAYEKLNEKTGDDFDKAYADMMVSGHKDAIGAFEKASRDNNDADIKSWATTSLTNLRTHLDRSIECQKNFDKI